MRKLIFTLVGMTLAAIGFAAGDNPRALLLKIQAFYASPAYLQFDMAYTYTGGTGKVIDSLYGHFYVSKNRYRVFLDSTETVANEKHLIQLFHKEKMMLVANRPSGNVNTTSPAAFLDSLLLKDSAALTLSDMGKLQELKISLPPGSTYKSVTLRVNPKTGFIHQAVYEIKTEEAPDDLKKNDTPAEDYAQVTVTYSNCSGEPFDTGIFEDARFIKQDVEELSPAADYAGYVIYNTTLNLK
ncbi:LolA family protein [Filimonas effusa]|uniref:DUF3108 domain-containing protein n=1 Tax=Filimonas effusa TaxID=2508721 RepID=A0A4V1MAH6_9BACT|nr:hypothetical protein [Filimonas effusa]RXK85906.1 hypothetical protein ESB13_03595 [Filimonas effusa]